MHKEKNIILKRHPHWFFSLQFYFLGILLIALGFVFRMELAVLGLLVVVLVEIVRRAHTYYLLENGIVKQYRFLSTSRKFTEYEKIQNIEVTQSFVENIFGIGGIKFDTPGSDTFEIHFSTVKNPHQIEKIVRDKITKI
jgi:uncharacterized membrane protein YdbT with pleckstrin-like domain